MMDRGQLVRRNQFPSSGVCTWNVELTTATKEKNCTAPAKPSDVIKNKLISEKDREEEGDPLGVFHETYDHSENVISHSLANTSNDKGEAIDRDRRETVLSQSSYGRAVQQIDDVLTEDDLICDLLAWQRNDFTAMVMAEVNENGKQNSHMPANGCEINGEDEEGQIRFSISKKDMLTLRTSGNHSKSNTEPDEPLYAVVRKVKNSKKGNNDVVVVEGEGTLLTTETADLKEASNEDLSPVSLMSHESSIEPYEDPGYESLDSIQANFKGGSEVTDETAGCLSRGATCLRSPDSLKPEERNTLMLSENILVVNNTPRRGSNTSVRRGTPMLTSNKIFGNTRQSPQVATGNISRNTRQSPQVATGNISRNTRQSPQVVTDEDVCFRMKQVANDIHVKDTPIVTNMVKKVCPINDGVMRVSDTPILLSCRSVDSDETGKYKDNTSNKNTEIITTSRSPFGSGTQQSVPPAEFRSCPSLHERDNYIGDTNNEPLYKSENSKNPRKKKLILPLSLMRYFDRSASKKETDCASSVEDKHTKNVHGRGGDENENGTSMHNWAQTYANSKTYTKAN